MSDTLAKMTSLSSLKKALLIIEELESKAAARNTYEPVAVIGMAFRLPGGCNTSQRFWEMLQNTEDVRTEVPPGRWDHDRFYDENPDAPGKIYTRYGYYLDNVDMFDAGFFNISPREVKLMDPQHRLMLEVCWEALENAGKTPIDAEGSTTGVYVGITTNDYLRIIENHKTIDEIEAYYNTGNVSNASAGRISYILGLQGPAIALDTACSSSLVTVHLACQALRNRDCSTALAGGVNLILSPYSSIGLCKAKMLSPDGYCKTFDASANGYARGEGCGVVVLKLLKDAILDRDNILGVIRASAVQQDGQSSGFTAPNGNAQISLMQKVLQSAQIDPGDISYIEAHGTGTELGDPIELNSINEVYGKGRKSGKPLLVGSVKTNIGHLESASGIAGLIKVLLMLQHKKIPKHLHFKEPNPHFCWDSSLLKVPAATTPWVEEAQKRLASVNSFGISGTIANLIVEEPPVVTRRQNHYEPDEHLLFLSAKSKSSLEHLVRAYRSFSWGDNTSLADICYSANTGRVHFAHRLAVTGNSLDKMLDECDVLLKGSAQTAVAEPGKRQPELKTGFLFPDEDAGYLRMAKELYETNTFFRETMEKCSELFQPLTGISLTTFLYPQESAADSYSRSAFAQPALLAIEYCLAQLWISWGIRPAVVTGCGAGEYAAACIAGLFSLKDGLALLTERNRLMHEIEPVFNDFLKKASTVEFSKPVIPVLSSLTGEKAHLSELANPAYWFRQIREQPDLSKAVHTALEMGITSFIETGPGTGLITRINKDPDHASVFVIPSLIEGQPDWHTLLKSLSVLYMNGKNINWCEIDAVYPRHRILLPNYPFEKKRFWIDEKGKNVHGSKQNSYADGTGAGLQPAEPADSWLYEVQWLEAPLENFVRKIEDQAGEGLWIIFSDKKGFSRHITCELEKNKINFITIGYRDEYADGDGKEGAFDKFIDLRSAEACIKTIKEIVTLSLSPIAHIIYLWPLDATPVEYTTLASLESDQDQVCRGLLYLLQALGSVTSAALPPITVVTENIHPLSPDNMDLNIVQAPAWGIARVMQLEMPEIWGGIIDIGCDNSVQDAQAVITEIINRTAEKQVAWRSGKRYIPRLTMPDENKFQVKTTDDFSGCFSPHATYLITGGCGFIGSQLARWLETQGIKNIVLLGRKNPGPEVIANIREMETRGVKVYQACGDVASYEDMERICKQITETMPPLKGIFHTAGILHDSLLYKQSWEDFKKTLPPKIKGTWNLYRLLKEKELDFLILFSAAASLLGSPGQGSYVAANLFLDSFSHFCRKKGLPVLSINWGRWDGKGLADNLNEQQRRQWLAQGRGLISPSQGCKLLGHLMKKGLTGQIGVLPMDWDVFISQYSVENFPRLLSLLADKKQNLHVKEKSPAAVSNILEKIPERNRKNFIIQLIRTHVAKVLSIDHPDDVSTTTGFFEMGMDSLMAVELKNNLQKELGIVLHSTIAFSYPTIEELADYVIEMLQALQKEDKTYITIQETAEQTGEDKDALAEPIAIIGLGCRFPGGADNPEGFWKNLCAGEDAITGIPESRWDVDLFYDKTPGKPGKMYTKHGGFLKDPYMFDTDFFSLSPREVIYKDPQHRLLLEVAWEALEHAGIPPESLIDTETGVFIGITNNDFVQMLSQIEITDIDGFHCTGSSFSVAAGHISYLFGFRGPCVAVDTACSSSLVAVHQACLSLKNRECDTALAGGVNLILSPVTMIALSQLKVLSADGRCKTFDAAADGYVRGEGCGIVVLKRLSDAVKAHDNILAVIRQTAVLQDGYTSGLTVPNGSAQKALFRSSLSRANIDPLSVSYIECHGTGTSLGDPIEINSVGEVFCRGRTKENPLLVSSVKTNIGHLESASGIAGLIKTVLALQNKMLPPHLHFKKVNAHIPLEEYNMEIPLSTQEWTPANHARRICCVNSFGFAGTITHAILEEAPSPVAHKQETSDSQHILCLSAKSDDALKKLVSRYTQYLNAENHVSLEEICYSTNTGRNHFSRRMAIIASTRDSLLEQLQAFSGHENAKTLFPGHAKNNESGKIGFLFSDRNYNRSEGLKKLYEQYPVFHLAIEYCLQIAGAFIDMTVSDVICPEETRNKDNSIPPLKDAISRFVLGYGMYKLWTSCGLVPDAVAGFGAGDILAAVAAEIMSPEDGLKLLLKRYGKNNKSHTTSEKTDFDSDVAHDNQHDARESFTFHIPKVLFVSGKTGIAVPDEELCHLNYWNQDEEKDSALALCLEAMHDNEVRYFLEIGPDDFLITEAKQYVSDPACVWLSTLTNNGAAGNDSFLLSLACLYVKGKKISWQGYYQDIHVRRVLLPTYPFQRKSYPLKLKIEKTAANVTNQQTTGFEADIVKATPVPSLLLGNRLSSPAKQIQYENTLDLERIPLLKEHVIYNIAIVSGPTQTVTMLEAFLAMSEQKEFVIKDVTFIQPIAVFSHENRKMQTVITPVKDGQYECGIFSIPVKAASDGKNWIQHSSSKIFVNHTSSPDAGSKNPGETALLAAAIKELETHRSSESEVEQYYATFNEIGYTFGTSYKWIQSLKPGNREALCRMRPPLTEEEMNYPGSIHPGLFDTCFQILVATLPREELESKILNTVYVPIYIESFRFYKKPEGQILCYARLHPEEAEFQETFTGDLFLYDDTGKIFSELRNVTLKKTASDVLLRKPGQDRVYKKMSLAFTLEDLLKAPFAEQQQQIISFLKESICATLMVPAGEFDSERPLVDYGMNSIMGIEIKNQCEQYFNIKIPVELLLEGPSVLQLTASIQEQLGNTSSGPGTSVNNEKAQKKQFDLKDEVQLAADIVVPATVFHHPVRPQKIFLTGATGFIGGFLAARLAQQGCVYCLVRAASENEGKERIRENIQKLRLWNKKIDARLIPVCGDLAKPSLGLSTEEFEKLGKEIEVIYHDAAVVNFNYPYDSLRAVNVDGTKELLRLACVSKRPFHYVSTYSILFGYIDREIITEDILLDRTAGLFIGYSQSKWVAENLVKIAGEKGLPVCIYRPGFVGADSEWGVFNRKDLMTRMLKGCLDLGIAPKISMRVDIVPVDYLANTIAYTSTRDTAYGKVYHLINTNYIGWEDLVNNLRILGYDLDLLPYDEWYEKVRAVSTEESILYPLMPFLARQKKLSNFELYSQATSSLNFDCSNTREILKGTSIACPPVDQKLLRTYLLGFIRDKYINLPRKSMTKFFLKLLLNLMKWKEIIKK